MYFCILTRILQKWWVLCLIKDATCMPKDQTFQETLERQKRKTISFDIYDHKKWPTTIPYKLHDSLTDIQKASIKAVLQEDFVSNTCLRFTEQVLDIDQFIVFKQSAGQEGECKAYIGREHDVRTTNFQGQPIYLDDHCFVWRGSLLYLIATTLGMYGEAKRPDRDEYIDILVDNMDPSGIPGIEQKDEVAIDTHGIPYDYGSVLHPGPRNWLKEGLHNESDVYTILPKDLRYLRVMGQQSELSFYDIKAINMAYCAESCEVETDIDCQNGGYVDPNHCDQCKCPDGYSGRTCDIVASGSTDCTPSSGTIFVSETTTCVMSPNYKRERPYEVGDECAWKVNALQDKAIQFWFEDEMALPHVTKRSTDACLHWVEIQQTNFTNHRGFRYCGYRYEDVNPSTSDPLISSSSEVLVIFKSPNASISAQTHFPNASRIGFKLCFNTTNQVIVSTENPNHDRVRVHHGKSAEYVMFITIIAALGAVAIGLVLIVVICGCKRRQKLHTDQRHDTVISHRPGEVSLSPVYTIYDGHAVNIMPINNTSQTDNQYMKDSIPPEYEEQPPPYDTPNFDELEDISKPDLEDEIMSRSIDNASIALRL